MPAIKVLTILFPSMVGFFLVVRTVARLVVRGVLRLVVGRGFFTDALTTVFLSLFFTPECSLSVVSVSISGLTKGDAKSSDTSILWL